MWPLLFQTTKPLVSLKWAPLFLSWVVTASKSFLEENLSRLLSVLQLSLPLRRQHPPLHPTLQVSCRATAPVNQSTYTFKHATNSITCVAPPTMCSLSHWLDRLRVKTMVLSRRWATKMALTMWHSSSLKSKPTHFMSNLARMIFSLPQLQTSMYLQETFRLTTQIWFPNSQHSLQVKPKHGTSKLKISSRML